MFFYIVIDKNVIFTDINIEVVIMDIAKLSMNMAEAKVTQGVQIGMLKRAMKQMEQTGVQLAQMLQVTAVPAAPKEGAIDIKV